MGHLFPITLPLRPDFSQNVSCFDVHVKQKQTGRKQLQAMVIKKNDIFALFAPLFYGFLC